MCFCGWREREREREFEFKLFYIAACHTAYNSITCTVPKIVTNEFIVHAFIIQLLNELQ